MGDQTWWEKLIAVMPEFDGNGADEAQVRYFDSLDRLFALVERANQAPPPGPRYTAPLLGPPERWGRPRAVPVPEGDSPIGAAAEPEVEHAPAEQPSPTQAATPVVENAHEDVAPAPPDLGECAVVASRR